MTNEIQMITFDLDDTLWDNKPTITNAEIKTRKWIEDRVGAIEWGDLNDFLQLRETLIKKDKSIAWDIRKLRIEIFKENQIKGIVVGNPINMDGSSSNSSQSAKDLAINLSKDVTENVVLWDERLSSQGAFNLSNDLASNTTKKVSKLDQNSAQFILQGVLDYLTK